MNSYIEDILVKCRCRTCGNDFIISEHQMSSINKNIACPYCHSEDTKKLMYFDYEDLGCMNIGHHTNIQDEKESYEFIWGQIIQLKINKLEKEIDKFENEIDELNKCKYIYK